MKDYFFTGDPVGLKITGQTGGANGHFIDVDVLDPKTNKRYTLGATNDGHVFIAKKDYTLSLQLPLTKGYNVKGMIITDGFSPYNNGIYNFIELTDPKTGKKFDVNGNYNFQMVEIHPAGSKNVELMEPLDAIEYGECEPSEEGRVYSHKGHNYNLRKQKLTAAKSKRKPVKKVTKKVVKKCKCK